MLFVSWHCFASVLAIYSHFFCELFTNFFFESWYAYVARVSVWQSILVMFHVDPWVVNFYRSNSSPQTLVFQSAFGLYEAHFSYDTIMESIAQRDLPHHAPDIPAPKRGKRKAGQVRTWSPCCYRRERIHTRRHSTWSRAFGL